MKNRLINVLHILALVDGKRKNQALLVQLFHVFPFVEGIRNHVWSITEGSKTKASIHFSVC